ncbi:hypothetical protein NDU88_005518 [Pleurodeles waltl]|uniref:Uncharacterized protein n=1 Tax=Pleurodeles waltl TaxID=8319 RepID=A0AAV7SLX6_PLEWA|nr:hypothetical protein NDU88_005518 [Pleurodeles waltl]
MAAESPAAIETEAQQHRREERRQRIAARAQLKPGRARRRRRRLPRIGTVEHSRKLGAGLPCLGPRGDGGG